MLIVCYIFSRRPQLKEQVPTTKRSPQHFTPMMVSPEPGSQYYGSQQFHQISPQHMQMSGGNQHRSPGSQFSGPHQISPQAMQMAAMQRVSPRQMHVSPRQMQAMGVNQISPRSQQQYSNTRQTDNIHLMCGHISAQDLQPVHVIGSGNGGQVYK